MPISVDSTHPSTISNNTSSQLSKLGKAFRSLTVGTALALGTLAPTAAAVAQEKPPENIPVQEEPKNESEKKDGRSCFLDILIAYTLGRTFGYFHGKRVGSAKTLDESKGIKANGPTKEEKKI